MSGRPEGTRSHHRRGYSREAFFRSFPLKNVAGFYVGEGQGEEQNPYPENDDVHGARSLGLFIFALYVATLRPAGRNHTNTL
jgi:hypothetical protein